MVLPALSSAPPAAARLSEAAEAWSLTKDTTNIAALEAFINRYRNTYYGDLARLRIDELKKQQVPVTVPIAQPDRSELERAAAFIKETEDQRRLEEFIRQFGDSAYAPMAQARLEELKRQAAVIAPSRRCDGVETQVGNNLRCLKPGTGEVFKDCPECPEMVVIPAGEFMMGSPSDEAERSTTKVRSTR